MATGRKFVGKRLPLTLAFGVLVAAAIGAGCKGFFVNPTLTSITIDGPTSVPVGSSITLSAFGVYGTSGGGTGGGNTLTSGVSWSSSDPTVATITGACATGECGSATIEGASAGTSSISATSQAVTNSATITVYFSSISNFQVCEGSFGDATDCANSITWSPNDTSEAVNQDFIVQGVSNGTTYDLTTQSTWTVVGAPENLTCATGSSPVECTAAQGLSGTYTITITYPAGSSSPTATATITVNATG